MAAKNRPEVAATTVPSVERPPTGIIADNAPFFSMRIVPLNGTRMAHQQWPTTMVDESGRVGAPYAIGPLSPNTKGSPRQRSINLTLSARGIAAVQAIDNSLVERLLHNAVPLRGRMVHRLDGNATRQQYDRGGHCLYSIERGLLNTILLEAAGSVLNIGIQFLHRVQSVDFISNTVHLSNLVSGQAFDDRFDLCIGADGSNSVIRHHLMVATQMEYSQHYISHEYVEIRLPHGMDTSGHNTFLLDADHLHVWPRGDFTMVAMPNKNKTFTCALFAPKTIFDALQYPDTLIPFFKSHFPDLLSLLGEKRLLLEFQNNPRSLLITTKANPYHKGAVIIIGDAAHSMVPFYGQGLNCALEDVRILSILLRREKDGHNPSVIRRVLNDYSESRHEDLVAICDLAMDSHLKMRHTVATWSYMIRSFIDNILYGITETRSSVDLSESIFGPEVPSGWIPLYSMVSFRPDISYSAAKKKAARQEHLVDSVAAALGVLGLGYILYSIINLNRLF
ncbi:Kynurenine 3-monooxygenase [Mycena venus]|uniref:Kynurenine 3-monooxygenase n=1 Tax=Mycena venus TaxID=2733690 RepID=A0A8H6XVW3_9AGAR|nr:Kynurenine 3-monooxygenase [Mycena venus]